MPEGRDSVVQIKSMLGELSSYYLSRDKISKVPDLLRGGNEEAYDPTVVAIGPIHHNKNHVQGMQQHKVWYLQQLLQRTCFEQHNREIRGVSGAHFNDSSMGPERFETPLLVSYLAELRKSEERARQCYSSSTQLPDKEKFVEMLLLDGVFVIELARKYSLSSNVIRDEDDYIFHASEMRLICRDLLQIENQLPFFILKLLFDITKTEGSGNHLHLLVLDLFRPIIPGKPKVAYDVDVDVDADVDVDDHLLGLVYKAYFSNMIIHRRCGHNDFMIEEINSISELQEGGIKFKRVENAMLLDVRFTGRVLEIPKLDVGDDTESLFRNLVAYEQTRVGCAARCVTEYCFLMQFLINSTKDVEILRRAGIVINWMGDDETVRLFFNKLTKNVVTSPYYYSNTIPSMNEYCRRRKWWANLEKNYFNSPWSIISVVAATILLLMTAVQTVFTVVSYTKGTLNPK